MAKLMKIRKAIILAGGSGTRLRPLTLATNKHLLPLYDKPVIYHAIEKLVEAGISRIMVVTSPDHIDSFVRTLGSGQHWKPRNTDESQIQIAYGIQNEPGGIAQGLYIARDYVGDEPCILFLGDNYFEDDLSAHIRDFTEGAMVFLKKVPDPHRFGIATLGKEGEVLSIEEKPKKPKSDLAVAGIYLYDNTVFEKMRDQKPSARGEYEITYVNNKYIKEGKLRATHLKKKWSDIGTIDSLIDVSHHIKKKHDRHKK
ncbi:MAG: glucose-1-phosphate thymidylyltransferase [Parcubacteria group bacterium Gr01-1014_8]|nr:MAG: glucose-1-phosphate thymidylyltransferase [Parcubacteria group bacterium Gr01-1014_8]